MKNKSLSNWGIQTPRIFYVWDFGVEDESQEHMNKCGCPLLNLVCDRLGQSPSTQLLKFKATVWYSLGWKVSGG